MQHLSESHALNAYVTTMTSHVRMFPAQEDTYVTPSDLSAAIARLGETGIGVRRSFKNCAIIWVSVHSSRQSKRVHNVSVKIFSNLMLHVTGAHSTEMVQTVVDKLVHILGGYLGVPLTCRGCLRVTMVNYKYALPGRVNLFKLVTHLLGSGTLVIFDPSNYAGARIKLPLPETQKTASIMVFESGKVIIVLPESKNRDNSLAFVRTFLDTRVVLQWVSISLDG